MAIGPSGFWAAVGQSSGFLTILDIRTGLVIASWKGHEGEVCWFLNGKIISAQTDASRSYHSYDYFTFLLGSPVSCCK